MSSDPDDLISDLVDDENRCRICGQIHSPVSTFEGIKTSIDVISEIFGECSKPKVVKESLKLYA